MREREESCGLIFGKNGWVYYWYYYGKAVFRKDEDGFF